MTRFGVCPECAHDRDPDVGNGQSWIGRKLRLKLRPATCAIDMRFSGWYDACGCDHPFHGS